MRGRCDKVFDSIGISVLYAEEQLDRRQMVLRCVMRGAADLRLAVLLSIDVWCVCHTRNNTAMPNPRGAQLIVIKRNTE